MPRLTEVVTGLVACLLLAACSSGGDEPDEPRVTAAKQCDDTLSPEAARALETVLQTKTFDHDPEGGLGRVVSRLIEDYDAGGLRSPGRRLCRSSADSGSARVDILFGRYDDSDLIGDRHPVDLLPYEGMGREAWSGPRGGYLFVRCVSPQLQGSRRHPAQIFGTIRVRRVETPDTVAVREANLTILHSVTLAVVKKLGCEGNAGLPEEPVFKAR